jgi:D-beta-D-heptose 7-phosphate kinase/D-beta-D-heptose 1-phosphate adenosyltransferase
MLSSDRFFPTAQAFLAAVPRPVALCFTNGCFDLLHPGHVKYLEDARALGDFLVVGLNSDASVARLKGPGRPLQDEAARAAVLLGLRSVDAVVRFDEDTPLELIQALQPDVLVKGGDYTPETVVGREIVEGRGGRLVLIPFLPGHSTSRIEQRIRSGRGVTLESCGASSPKG